MTTRDVQVATVAERDAVFAILTLAFSSDPATRWTWPEPKAYIEAFPHFATAFGGAAFEKGSALRVGSAGAALWLPPGTGPDEAALNALMDANGRCGDCGRRPAAHAADGELPSRRSRTGTCRCSASTRRTRTRASAARCCDTSPTAAIATACSPISNSSNPRNIPLYERHGFEIVGRAQSGSSPVITPMLRKPQRR